jgi:hypothetical protein
MMSKSLHFAIGFLLLIAQTQSARYNQENLIVDAQTTGYPAFLYVENYQLSKVCDDSAVHKFGVFFEGWVIKTLLSKQFKSPTSINSELKGLISEHVEEIQKYLAEFNAKQDTLAKYGQTYFDVELKDLLSRINQVLGVPFNNKYDQAEPRAQLVSELGHYAGHVVNEVAMRHLDLGTIQKIGQIFFEEYNKPQKEAGVEAVLSENTKDIIAALETILDIYGNNPAAKKYDLLTEPEKDQLQKFYDVFKPLLDPKKVKKQVYKILTGDEKFKEQSSDFFTP